MNDVAMHVGEPTLQTIVIKGQSLMIQAHQVQERGIEVVEARRMFFGFEPESIAATVTVSFSDACPCQKTGEGVWVVVAPGSISLKKRHAPKLRTPNYESVLEQTPALHISDESSRGLIHDLGLHGMSLGNVAMGIPIRNSISARGITPIEKLNDPNSLLEQTTGKDTILCILPLQVGSGIRPIFFLNGCGFG